MSSFGGVDIPVGELGIDFIVSSANKMYSVGVPGFSFIICRRDSLVACEGKARSLPWISTTSGKQWKKTANGDSLPPHTVLAFAKALEELDKEEGSRRAPNATMTTTAF